MENKEFKVGQAAAFKKAWREGNRLYEGKAGIITAVGNTSVQIQYPDGKWFCPVIGNVYSIFNNKGAAQFLEKEL